MAKGITFSHRKEVFRTLNNFRKYILSKRDKSRCLSYFQHIQNNYSVSYYRKQMYQILRYLQHVGIDWTSEIILPSEPNYEPFHVDIDEIKRLSALFSDNLMISSLIQLGITTGLRAHELYQLRIQDIDIDNRMVHVVHNPDVGMRTKNNKTRISFFTPAAGDVLSEYLASEPNILFPQTTIRRRFHDAPIRVKDLRKFFSQTWDRHGGPTGVKKILMGHSMRNDVDLMHYNCQSEEDLKKIYDGVMN